MKNVLILILLCTVLISCKAQIIPIENTNEYEDEYEFAEGTYFKDVNGKLANFYGHWKSIDAPDGKQLDIYISEYVKTDIVGVIYEGIFLNETDSFSELVPDEDDRELIKEIIGNEFENNENARSSSC